MLYPTVADFIAESKMPLLAEPGDAGRPGSLPIIALGCIQFLELASHDLELACGSPSWPESKSMQDLNEFAKSDQPLSVACLRT